MYVCDAQLRLEKHFLKDKLTTEFETKDRRSLRFLLGLRQSTLRDRHIVRKNVLDFFRKITSEQEAQA
jgi:hypothetical protein